MKNYQITTLDNLERGDLFKKKSTQASTYTATGEDSDFSEDYKTFTANQKQSMGLGNPGLYPIGHVSAAPKDTQVFKIK